MVLLALLLAVLAVLVAPPPAAATAADHSLIAVTKSGLMHLDFSGGLLAWRPEVFQWWQAWHVATNPRNGTVCWVSAPEDQSLSGVVRCAPLANLNQTWDLPQPHSMRVNKADALALDWVNENWYITESRVNYVCSYLFDRCLKLGESGGNVRYFAAYDIPNRLLFRIVTTGGGPYRLESVRLDGTGLRVLPTNLSYPAGMAVDPVRRQLYVLDETPGWTDIGIFSVDYDGNGKQLVQEMDEVWRADWERSIDVVDGDIAITWNDQKFVSTVLASNGEKTDLVAGAVKGETVPALAKVEDLLAVKIFSPKMQPDVEEGCSNAGCQDLCIPTVVNDTAEVSCFCPEGHQLVDLTCQKQYPAYAVVVGADALQAVDLQTEEVNTILSDLTNGTKVDFFWAGGEEFLLFWLDDGSLFSGRWSPGAAVSGMRRLVQASETVRVLEVAVDWDQRHLLWMEKDPSKSKYDDPLSVKMSPFNGSHVKTMMSDSWSDQRALVITRSGKLFVYAQSSWGDLEFKVHDMTGDTSYDIFGSSGSKLLTTLPADIVVDISLSDEIWPDRIFWVNKGTQSVEFLYREFMFGQQRHTQLLTHPSLAHAGGLDVLDSRLFWTDRTTGQLWTADSVTGGGVRALPVVTGGRAVRVLHPWRQPPTGKPACDQQRNGCSHFCVHVWVDWSWVAQCACPDGQQLGDDKKTCQSAEPETPE